jgi:photosystem II stability/assembly factor-like uncharacterized protein
LKKESAVREYLAANQSVTTKTLLALLMSMLLLACEARLDLNGVEKTSAMPIKRFDQFQAAAKQGETLVVVSSNGAVVVSTDGTKNWLRHELPGAPVLIDVAGCPDGSFAALDAKRKIWLSADGGKTWKNEEIDTDESVTTLACGPDNRLWVGGSFTSLFNSADQGANWEATSMDEDAILTSIQFVDEEFAVILGEFGLVIFSFDGGETWEIGPSLPNDFYPQAGLFLDQENGFVVGLNGRILRTTDGGTTWEYEDTGTDTPLYGLTSNGSDTFAVGEGGEMLRLLGDRWEQVLHGQPVRSYLRAVAPVNDHQLLIAGGAGALFLVPMN